MDYAFDRRNFVEILGQIETNSKIEEMLLLLIADDSVEGFKIQEGQLFLQKIVNGDLKDGKRLPNWELTTEHVEEFFNKLIEVVGKEDLKRSKGDNIYFKDMGVRIELRSRVYQDYALLAYKRKQSEGTR